MTASIVAGTSSELATYLSKLPSKTPCVSAGSLNAFVLLNSQKEPIAYLELDLKTRLESKGSQLTSQLHPSATTHATIVTLCADVNPATLKQFIEESASKVNVFTVFSVENPLLFQLGFTLYKPGIVILRLGGSAAIRALLDERGIAKSNSGHNLVFVGSSVLFGALRTELNLSCLKQSPSQANTLLATLTTGVLVDETLSSVLAIVELEPFSGKAGQQLVRTLCAKKENIEEMPNLLRITSQVLHLTTVYVRADDAASSRFQQLGFLPDLETAQLMFFDLVPAPAEDASTVKKAFNAYRRFRNLREAARPKPPEDLERVRTECIFVGQASAQTPTKELMSYCFDSASCTVRFCFSIAELQTLAALPGAKFPFKAQIEHAAQHRGITLHVMDTFDASFLQAIEIRANEIMGISNEPFAKLVTDSLQGFLAENPEAMNEGSFLVKAGRKALEWTKWILRSGLRLTQWLMNHQLFSTIIFHVSRLLRLVICSITAGVDPKDLELIWKTIYSDMESNPLSFAIWTFGNIIVNCTKKLLVGVTGGITGWVSAVIDCASGGLLDSASVLGIVWKWFAEWLAYFVRKLFTFFDKPWIGDQIAGLLECTADIWNIIPCVGSKFFPSAAKAEFDKERESEAVMASQEGAGSSYALMDFGLLTFYFLLSLVPAKLFTDWLRAVLGWFNFGLYGVFADRVSTAIQNSLKLKKAPSLLDAFLTLLRFGSVYQQARLLVAELYAWVFEVFGCSLRYLGYRLGLMEKPDPMCCFASEVQRLKNQVKERDTKIALEKEQEAEMLKLQNQAAEAGKLREEAKMQADAAVAAFRQKEGYFLGRLKTYDEATQRALDLARERATDAFKADKAFQEAEKGFKPCDPRLKVKLNTEPVRRVDGIDVYLFRWNKSNRAKGLWTSVGLEFPEEQDSFLAVSALDVQKLYPAAVHAQGPREVLFIAVHLLPTELADVLAASPLTLDFLPGAP